MFRSEIFIDSRLLFFNSSLFFVGNMFLFIYLFFQQFSTEAYTKTLKAITSVCDVGCALGMAQDPFLEMGMPEFKKRVLIRVLIYDFWTDFFV